MLEAESKTDFNIAAHILSIQRACSNIATKQFDNQNNILVKWILGFSYVLNLLTLFCKKRKPPGHHAVDLEEKPLLYEYYANTLNPIIDRRGILGDEVETHAGKRSIDADNDRYAKRFFLERSRMLPSLQEQQQKQQTVQNYYLNLNWKVNRPDMICSIQKLNGPLNSENDYYALETAQIYVYSHLLIHT